MRELRTENELIANWKGEIDKPLVSICCITYNHEPYIEEALEGFLIQETEFPFEILIHDDASTDKTADIIREYEAKYPRLIKPIYQTENQYSKGVKMNPTFNFPRAKGEYIALCEGDDFWIDSNKLERQMKALRAHPNIDLCFHPAIRMCKGIVYQRQPISWLGETEMIVSASEVARGGGGMMPTASLVIRSNALANIKMYFSRNSVHVGDVFLQYFGASKGGAVYLPEIMSTYRVGHPGSWSSRQGAASSANLLEQRFLNLKTSCSDPIWSSVSARDSNALHALLFCQLLIPMLRADRVRLFLQVLFVAITLAPKVTLSYCYTRILHRIRG